LHPPRRLRNKSRKKRKCSSDGENRHFERIAELVGEDFLARATEPDEKERGA
jgi:hypothetical protein